MLGLFNKGKTAFFSALLLVFTAQPSHAVNLNPLAFDFNGNGRIDTKAEKDALIAWVNENSQLSDTENPIRQTGRKKKKKEPRYDVGFKIRRNFSEISLLENPEDLETRLPQKGALFSYTSDIENGSNVFAATGAIYIPVFVNPSQQHQNTIITNKDSFNYRSGALFGVGFDYLDNGSPQRVKDDLNFYAGYQQFRLGGILGDGLWRFSTQYETDFDFDSSLIRGDLSWFPINTDLRINTRQNFGNGRFNWQTSFSVKGSVKHIFQEGSRMQLSKQDSYYGVSAPIGFTFVINDSELIDLEKGVNPLISLYAKWTPAYGELPSGDFEHLFEAGSEIFLGGGTNHSLNFEYKKGTIPFDGTRIEQFMASLSVKF